MTKQILTFPIYAGMYGMFSRATSFKQVLPKEWAKKAGYENPKEVKKKTSLKLKTKVVSQEKGGRGDE